MSFFCALLVALRPLNFLSDDCLFYLVIAEHLANGQGSTFNGLFATNGYHPLWEGLATVLALLPHTKALLLAYGVIMQWLLGIATLWLLYKALRPYFSPPACAAFVAAMVFFFVPFGNLFWTEAPLSMVFVALTLRLLLAEGPLSYVALGVTLGLLFLSRLDNVFLIGCIVLGLGWRDRERRLVIACLICAAIAGAYLATNLINFGHIMPISGAVKSSISRGLYFSGRLGPNGWLGLAGAVSLALMTLVWPTRPPRYRLVMLLLAGGVMLQTLYVWMFTYADTTWVWYYVQGYLCVALVVAEGIDRLRSPAYVGNAVLSLSVVLSIAIAAAKFLLNWSWHDPHALAGHWKAEWIAEIQRALPDDQSVLIVLDQPGLFAYSTTHPVFALDGLTMNYQVDQELASRGMYAQLAALGTTYLMAPAVAEGAEFRTDMIAQRGVRGGHVVHFFAPLGRADAGCIRIDAAALVTKRPVPPVILGGVWGVWKLTAATMHPIRCPADV